MKIVEGVGYHVLQFFLYCVQELLLVHFQAVAERVVYSIPVLFLFWGEFHIVGFGLWP